MFKVIMFNILSPEGLPMLNIAFGFLLKYTR